MSDKKANKQIFIFLGIVVLVIVLGVLVFFLTKPSPKPITSLPPSPPKPEKSKITFQNFEEVVAQLDTPQKLIAYLNENFKLKEEKEEKPLSPEKFFAQKEGTAWDFAVFVSYVLWKNKFDAGIVRYKFDDKINAVVVFRDKDLPKTIIFTSKGVKIYPHGWSFEEMFQKEEERLGIKITEYAISYWTDKGDLWPEEWRERK